MENRSDATGVNNAGRKTLKEDIQRELSETSLSLGSEDCVALSLRLV